MARVLSWTLLIVVGTTVTCEHILGTPGLHFDYGKEYASHYDNYQPHDYQFDYGVSDPHTGDHKSQWEVKEKGVVRGGYSLLEPDGTTRIVEYIADDGGFRAVVKKIGASIHPSGGVSVSEERHGGYGEVPVVVPEALPEPLVYNAYDGQADNYQQYQPLEVVPHQPLNVVPQQYHQPLEFAPQQYHHQPSQQYHQPLELVPQQQHPEVVPHQQYHQQQPQVLLYPQASGLGHNQEWQVPQGHQQHYEYVPVPQHGGHSSVQGLTGNPDDDVQYSNDGSYSHATNYYVGEYSQKVHRVVPAPHAKEVVPQQQEGSASQFIIYYPDPSSYEKHN